MKSFLLKSCLAFALATVAQPSLNFASSGFKQQASAVQTAVPDNGKYLWSASLSSGPLLYYGDMRAYGFWPASHPYSEINAGYGLSISRQIHPYFDVQLNLMTGHLSGEKRAINDQWSEQNPQYFKGNIFEASVTARFNITPLIQAIPQKLDIIGYAGAGIVQYRAISRYMFTNKLYSSVGYSSATDASDGPASAAASALTIPLGININYHISSRVAVGVDLGQRLTTSDNLDAWVGKGSKKDGYGFYALKVIYCFNPVFSARHSSIMPAL